MNYWHCKQSRQKEIDFENNWWETGSTGIVRAGQNQGVPVFLSFTFRLRNKPSHQPGH